jgi:hypothetical protein
MPYPASLTTVTVTGTVTRDGVVKPGYARIYSGVTLRGPAGEFVVGVDERVDLDVAGAFSLVVPATNDPDWVPVGFTYRAVLEAGGEVVRGTLSLPYTDTAVDMTSVFNLDTDPEAGSTYLLLSARGTANGVASLGSDGLVPSSQLPGGSGESVAWDSITGKPTTFAPSSHTHPISQVTDLQTDLDALTAVDASLDARVTTLESAPGGGGGAAAPTFVRARVTSGDITTSADAAWAVVPGLSLSLPAATGDDVEVTASFLLDQLGSAADFFDLVVLVSGAIVRAASSDTATPTAEGDPALYPDQDVRFRGSTTSMGFTVASGDRDGSNVVFGFAHKGTGGAKILASASYPLRWRARNDH